jgi:subtilisin family serine protease
VDGGTTSTSLNGGYVAKQGTSMAAPVVSGAIALLAEDYRSKVGGGDPLPSSWKAILIHSAEDLVDGTPHYNVGPDFASGYGRVDVDAALAVSQAGSFVEGEVRHDESQVYHFLVGEGL